MLKSIINEIHILLKDYQLKYHSDALINGCCAFLAKRLDHSSKEIDNIITQLKCFTNHNVNKTFAIHDIIFKNIKPHCNLYNIATGAAVNSIISGLTDNPLSINQIIANYTSNGSKDRIQDILADITANQLNKNMNYNNNNNNNNNSGNYNSFFGVNNNNFNNRGRGNNRSRGRGRGRNRRGRGRGNNRASLNLQSWISFCAKKGISNHALRYIGGKPVCRDFNMSSCNRNNCPFAHGCPGCGFNGHNIDQCNQKNGSNNNNNNNG